jgi:hypothetical protein
MTGSSAADSRRARSTEGRNADHRAKCQSSNCNCSCPGHAPDGGNVVRARSAGVLCPPVARRDAWVPPPPRGSPPGATQRTHRPAFQPRVDRAQSDSAVAALARSPLVTVTSDSMLQSAASDRRRTRVLAFVGSGVAEFEPGTGRHAIARGDSTRESKRECEGSPRAARQRWRSCAESTAIVSARPRPPQSRDRGDGPIFG